MAYVTISKEVLIKEETKIPIEEYRKMQGYGQDSQDSKHKPVIQPRTTGRGSLKGVKLAPTKVSLESRQSISFGYKDLLSQNSSWNEGAAKHDARKPSLNIVPTDQQGHKRAILIPAGNLLGSSSSKSINYQGPQEFSMSEGRLEDLQSHSIEYTRGKSYEKAVKLSNFSNTQQLLMTTGKLQGSLQGSQKFSWGTNRTPKFPKDFKTSPRDRAFDDSDSRRHLHGGSEYTSEKVSVDKGASQKISNFYVTFKGYEDTQHDINMKIVPLDPNEGPLSSDNYLSLNKMRTGGPSQETVPSEAKTKPIRFLRVSLGMIDRKKILGRGSPLVKRLRTPALKKHMGDIDEQQHGKEAPREASNLQLPIKEPFPYSARRFSAASGFNMHGVESVDSENMFLIPGPVILDSQYNQQYTILAGISSMMNSADPRTIQGASSSTKKANKSKDSSNLIKSILRPKDYPPTPELPGASERSVFPRSAMSIDKDYSKVPSFNNLRSQLQLGPSQPTNRSKRSSSKHEDNTSGQPSHMFDSRSQHYFQRLQQMGAQEGPINLDTNLDIEAELRKNSALQNYAKGITTGVNVPF